MMSFKAVEYILVFMILISVYMGVNEIFYNEVLIPYGIFR